MSVIPRSRITNFISPHLVSIVRKVDRDTKEAGRVVSSCELVTLYENVPARIGELREFIENILAPANFGNASADIFRGMFAFPDLPHKLRRGDLVKVPWGIKPNYFIGEWVPFSPALIFGSPGGNVLLIWDGSQYTGSGYTFSSDYEGTWCLDGPDLAEPYCFETSNPLCEEFPEGFRFVKQTGPNQFYEILRFENQLDDIGYYHHTRVEMELIDTNTLKGA